MNEQSGSSASHIAFQPTHLRRLFSKRCNRALVAVEGRVSTVRHVNPAFLRLSGASRSKLIGLPFAEAVPEDETNGCAALLQRVYDSGKPATLIEQKHGNKPNIYWSYSAWPIRVKDRKTVGAMLQVADSTETAVFRNQAVAMNESLLMAGIRQHELIENTEAMNTRLQSALNEKEYFIAMLSHELRTPLTPVLIGASMLLQDQGLGAETRSVVEMVSRNITHEAHLIDDLLDISRMQNGKLNLDRKTVDLRNVLERSVEMCAAEVQSAQLSIAVSCGVRPQMIDADASRMMQVFCNLIRNAVKFTPARGSILIRARTAEKVCIVDVIDTGIGIDAEFLPNVFAAFAQRDKPRTRDGGLGLGLAICKMIVELHGGTISVHSEGKDRGSTLSLRLPAAPEADIAQQAQPPAHTPAMVKSLRILLVEDHIDTARVLKRLLHSEGHSVRVAGDVSSALTLAVTNEFDLMLSDIGLPDGNGWDLMTALRDRGSTLRGIALTGFGQDQDVERSHRAGFTTHLTKPLSLHALREAMASVHQ
jgi:two-component system CheB/CheR fusion protein